LTAAMFFQSTYRPGGSSVTFLELPAFSTASSALLAPQFWRG
jgi:hypothetical protein